MHHIPVRTLVIDDDEGLCRRLSSWLSAQAYDVAVFTNPSEGLRHAQSTPCELALVDLRLPAIDGSEVIATLCRSSPQTRVVAMSAFPDTSQVLAAMRAGARDVLEKPIQQPTLMQALDRQLAEVGIAIRSEQEFNRRLGARLRSLRQARERTQHEIAVAAAITPAQLSQIELGRTATSTWTLARICCAMKISLGLLFEKF